MYVVGLLGTTNGTSCGAPFVIFSGHPVERGGRLRARHRDGRASDFKAASMKVEGNVVAFAAADPAQLALPFDCAIAATSQDAGADEHLRRDRRAHPAGRGRAARGHADADAGATPLRRRSRRRPHATTPPVAVPKEAKLTVTLDGAPATIKPQQDDDAEAGIANDGSKQSSKVTVSLSQAARAVGGEADRRLLGAQAGAEAHAEAQGQADQAGAGPTTLKVTAKAGKLKAASSLLLRIGKAKKVGAAAPEAKKSPIVGTYWWRNVNHVDYAWDNRALYFVDGGTVYSGFPTGGLPATCTTPPPSPTARSTNRDGCLPYTFDEKSGAVTIGDKAGTFKDGKLTIDGNDYTPLQIPAAGKRYTFNEQSTRASSGMCGFITGCTTTQAVPDDVARRPVRPDAQHALDDGRPGHRSVDRRRQLPAGPARDLRGPGRRQDPADLRRRDREGRDVRRQYNHRTGAARPGRARACSSGADNFYPDPSP